MALAIQSMTHSIANHGKRDRISYVNQWLADNPHPCDQFLCVGNPVCREWWDRYATKWIEAI